MKDYTAWLDGQSVARGALAAVERKAREVFERSPHGAAGEWPTANLRITRGYRQYFVKAVVLTRPGA